MAHEARRGCGYRVVGGLYLCGEYRSVYCDRLPYPLDVCPVCSHGLKPTRSYVKVNPARLFGAHLIEREIDEAGYQKTRPTPCGDVAGCFVCQPREDAAFIITIGDKFYTPASFMDEAARLGISKRIPFVPRDLILGQTRVYLGHRKAVPVTTTETIAAYYGEAVRALDIETDKVEYKYGIFSAFIPQRVEKLIWQHEATEDTLKDLEKRGITPVIIPDGDIDHANISPIIRRLREANAGRTERPVSAQKTAIENRGDT